eukprot:GILK01011886.1.p1 GENE.GILK01011886.1~~GILK01011886.1.p1  ORF type:complete len:342 (-),score=38.72 GILK01011886.1:465-1454(-)
MASMFDSLLSSLQLLNCPYISTTDATAKDTREALRDLLVPGEIRVKSIEWLLNKYDGTLLENFEANSSFGSGRIAKLATVISILGLLPDEGSDAIQGKCGRDTACQFLLDLADFVITAQRFHTSDSNPIVTDDPCASDYVLLSAVAQKQARVFTDVTKLFPPDVASLVDALPQEQDLQDALQEWKTQLEAIHTQLSTLTTQGSFGQGGESYDGLAEVLRQSLISLSGALRRFDDEYTKEIGSWTDIEPPALTGLGPSAKRLCEQVEPVLRMLAQLDSSRQVCSALVTGSEQAHADTSTTSFNSRLFRLQDEIQVLEEALSRSTIAANQS